MKKLETSQIIENIWANRVITEREVLLLKRRANNGDNEGEGTEKQPFRLSGNEYT